MAAAATRSLENWFFTQVNGGEGTAKDEWLPVTSFPTTVHVELLNLKKIPDPFIGLHEWDVQWVGESEWAFKHTLEVSEKELGAPNVDLVFEGLDTFATVTLNGNEILKTTNQFISHRVAVKPLLKAGENDLHIHFRSAFREGRETEKAHLPKSLLWNGDSSRLHVRKAQYNYGWDWGPVLMTVGPWKPIKLEAYSTRIADVDVRVDVSQDLDAQLDAQIAFSGAVTGTAVVELKNPAGEVVHSEPLAVRDANVAHYKQTFASNELQLWYPVGYGKQPLYSLHVTLLNEGGSLLDAKTQTTAFRRVRIVQDPLQDQEGSTWLFEVNNIRVFCGGSNWIPADSFLTTVTKSRYRAWLELMVAGNQNMVRVWGGGIYEHDDFYSICDEIGCKRIRPNIKSRTHMPAVLVWQDFMFGCGQYPAYDSFIESVEEEAVQAVGRLRHHPSVVIFAGNNEDYQIAESYKLDLDYSDETSDFRDTNFPARYIYERLLPKAVGENSSIYYHRGSPYSGHGKLTTDRTYGDIHQWNVWHGTQEPWHNWDILAGRFVSEFGMQGYPDIRTVKYWLGGDEAEAYPQSRTMANHNKADGFERRIELYLVENFKHAFDIESYVYYTQVMQAETLASAYRLWRRNWKGRGREYTAGALVWQINDCWPVTSWAIVDYFLRPKPAFFTVARELRPYVVGMTRKEVQTFPDDTSAATFEIKTVLEIWGANSTLEEKNATLELTAFELNSDWTESWTQEVVLAPNSSTELFKGDLPGQPVRTRKSEVPKTIIVSARLLGEDGSVLARYSNWPEPFKFIHFPPLDIVDLQITVILDGETIKLETKKPIKGIILDVDGDEVKWSDQAIDLAPGDPQTVKAVGLNGRTVKARFLGDGTA
ncbi:beta-mannosidase [Coprinellus micaceus]|uniref:Beta-mannosidase B n=1 Tax=Coprinellus micaceus TaxID=71717 RepID=A0A4Y7T8E2_COPMI|nr:beta-mannosidase [Coprinellus micaceus]